MTLRTKLTGAVGALLMGSIALTAWGFYVSERRLLLLKMRDTQQALLDSFGQTCHDSLLVRDDLAAINAAKSLLRSVDVVEAYCLDGQGIVMAHSDIGRVGKLFSPTGNSKNNEVWMEPDGRKLLRLEVALPVGEEPPGRAGVVFSISALERLVDEATREVARRISAISLVTVLLGLAGALVLARQLVRPIEHIARGTREVARGHLDHRLTVKRRDEIGALAEDFNLMATRLGELDRMKEDFVSAVSHDLRTPLNAVINYARSLRQERRGPLNDIQKEYLDIIGENVLGLNRFVSDVLDLAKIRAGRMDYHIEPVDAEEALSRTSDLFHLEAERQGTRLILESTLSMRVLADSNKLDRILANLVSNALKYVPTEGGEVRLKAERRENNGLFSVSDNGPGISAAERAQLFERFSQPVPLPGPGGAGSQNTGLGLAVVKTFLEAMRGKIWVEGAPGLGASFQFTLPLAPAP